MHLNWTIEEQQLELKYTWKISRNASDFKINFFVKVGDGNSEGTGEVAPNTRYHETPEIIRARFAEFTKGITGPFESIAALCIYLDTCALPNALRFGIESAYLHYLCKNKNTSIYQILNIQAPQRIYTSFTLPIMETGAIAEFITNNSLSRFKYIKIKVNQQNGLETIKEISRLMPQPLMVDANEDWTDVEAMIRFMEEVKNLNILFIEQPLPAALNDEYLHLKKHSPFELIADESIIANADFDLLKKQFHGINMKLMKAGGYLNGLALLNTARQHGMKTMIGCMVETSLGISSAMHLCHGIDYIDLDGSLILKDEPFGLLNEVEGELVF